MVARHLGVRLRLDVCETQQHNGGQIGSAYGLKQEGQIFLRKKKTRIDGCCDSLGIKAAEGRKKKCGVRSQEYKDGTSTDVGEGRSIYGQARRGRERAFNQEEPAESRVPIGKGAKPGALFSILLALQ